MRDEDRERLNDAMRRNGHVMWLRRPIVQGPWRDSGVAASTGTHQPNARLFIEVPRPAARSRYSPLDACDTYWGSHGCTKRRGHRFGHVCCCECAPRRLRWLGPLLHRLRHNRQGCVGRAPYYGKPTTFYGDDA